MSTLPNTLWRWHASASVVHVISCLVLSFVAEFQWSDFPGKVGPVSYAYDYLVVPNRTDDWSLRAESKREWLYANPIVGVAVNEALTALSHVVGLVFACQANGSEEPETYAARESVRRWLEYSVTAGVLEVCLLLVYGVRDWFALLLVIALNAALQLGGGLQLDALRRSQDNDLYSEQRVWLLVQSFLFLFVQIFYTVTTAATSTAADSVLASSILYAVFYASFGLLQTCSHCIKNFDEWFETSNAFCLLSVTSKLCLSYHIVLVAKQIENVGGGLDDTINALNVFVVFVYVASGVGVIVYTALRYRNENVNKQAGDYGIGR